MLLNGDGKTNIIKDDSLENIRKYVEKYDVITCNPPFGTKIVEKRSKVLRQYDLGFEWYIDETGILKKTDTLLSQQLIKDERIAYNDPDKRPSHIVIV